MGLSIDREKVIKGLEHCANEADCRGCVYREQMKGRSDGCDCMREALARLKEQPKIVRCKDCKYANRLTPHSNTYECASPNALNNMFFQFHASDWFCADGERR